MRTFEERMAEIHRRSEKIIKERKATRQRILLACLPLILCIGLYSVLLLGQTGSSGDLALLPENVPQDDGGAMGTLNGSGSGIAYTELTIRPDSVISDGAEQTFTDVTQVHAAYTILIEQYRGNVTSESTTEYKGDADNSETTPKDNYTSVPKDTDTSIEEYAFTFTTPGGAEATFTLRGNELTDKTTGESHILTEEQLSRLKDTLGI